MIRHTCRFEILGLIVIHKLSVGEAGVESGSGASQQGDSTFLVVLVWVGEMFLLVC
jgi:hypothetical protein